MFTRPGVRPRSSRHSGDTAGARGWLFCVLHIVLRSGGPFGHPSGHHDSPGHGFRSGSLPEILSQSVGRPGGFRKPRSARQPNPTLHSGRDGCGRSQRFRASRCGWHALVGTRREPRGLERRRLAQPSRRGGTITSRVGVPPSWRDMSGNGIGTRSFRIHVGTGIAVRSHSRGRRFAHAWPAVGHLSAVCCHVEAPRRQCRQRA